MESTQKQEQAFETRKRVESDGNIQFHRKAINFSLPSESLRRSTNNRLDFMKFINQHTNDFQSERSDDKHHTIEEDGSQSKSSSLFQMGQLLEQKALQVKELCTRLEQRETQFIELEKKMMQLMEHNHNDHLVDPNSKIKCVPDDYSSASEAMSELGQQHTINIDYVFDRKDNVARQSQIDLRSTTKKLTRFKYLEPEDPSRPRLSLVRLIDQEFRLGPAELHIQYVPKCSPKNCLFQQGDDDFQNVPSIIPTKVTTNKIGLSSQLNVKIQAVAFRQDEHDLEEFQRNLSILLEARNSALTSLHMTPRYNKRLSMERVLSEQINNESQLSLCKFKRLVREVINCLNQIWKMGSKMYKQNQNELSGQILKGLKADLISFVEDFNKKYKAFKDLGLNSNLFELETLEKLNHMVELSKSFPCS